MRTIAMITSVGACVVALAAGGCGGPASEGPAPTTPTTGTTASTATDTPVESRSTEPAPGTPTEDRSARQWTMPNLVGANLQDAQNQIQQLTGGAVYFTNSHDLGGSNRNQVVDANWQVCTQNVGPGAAITPASKIDFGVVKLDESCP